MKSQKQPSTDETLVAASASPVPPEEEEENWSGQEFVVGDAASPPPAPPSQTPSIRIASPVTVGSPGAKEVTPSSQRIDEATPHSIASVKFEDPEWEEVTLSVLKQEGILHTVEEHPYGPLFPPRIDEPSDQEENSKRKSKKATVIESAECESTNLSKAKALLGGFVSTIGHSLSIFFTITPDSEGYERRGAERRRTVQHVAW